MGRTTWFDVDGIKRGEWTAEEDRMLVAYINKYGVRDWGALPKRAGLHRCGKSCRLRWLNYLKPGIKKGKFTPQEEDDIIKFHSLLGNRWAAIAKQMPNRTDNDIKNHWNSCLKKRLRRSGIDPMTHEPIKSIDPMTHEPIKSTSSSTRSSPAQRHSSSTTSFSLSSTGSVRLLNKLAAGISSRKLELDRIRTVMISSEPREVDEEEKMMISSRKEEEKVIGCFMEIDKNLITTMSLDELACDSSYYYYDDWLRGCFQ